MPVQGEKSAFLTFIPTRKTHTVFPSSTAASLSQHVHGTTRTEQVYLTVIAVSNFSLCVNCQTTAKLFMWTNAVREHSSHSQMQHVITQSQAGVVGGFNGPYILIYTTKTYSKIMFPFFFFKPKKTTFIRLLICVKSGSITTDPSTRPAHARHGLIKIWYCGLQSVKLIHCHGTAGIDL